MIEDGRSGCVAGKLRFNGDARVGQDLQRMLASYSLPQAAVGPGQPPVTGHFYRRLCWMSGCSQAAACALPVGRGPGVQPA